MTAGTSEIEAHLQAFAADLWEILAALERELVTLEPRRYDREMLDVLLRSVNRIEGSARRAGSDSTRELAGNVAALIERLRVLGVPLGPEYQHHLRRMLAEAADLTADAGASESPSRDRAPRPHP